LFLQSLVSIHKAKTLFVKRKRRYNSLEILVLLDHVVTE
jgi:acyl carrier protein phosphodiesterase